MQHIAFDIGNVLVHVDFNKFYNVMQSHGFTENEISEFIDDLEYGCNMGMLKNEMSIPRLLPPELDASSAACHVRVCCWQSSRQGLHP